jgi:hypothetical protein
MSSTIRPVRRAAQLAATRINEICKTDNSNTTPINTTDIGITRARENGYDNAVYVIRYLLDEFDSAKYEDQRSEIALKMFKYLNANPSILIYEPQFCESVLAKIDDINTVITTKEEMFKKADYSKAIKMMKMSMLINVRNSQMRTDIYKHLNEISSILDSYSNWSHRTELRSEMNTLINNYQTITQNSKSSVTLN